MAWTLAIVAWGSIFVIRGVSLKPEIRNPEFLRAAFIIFLSGEKEGVGGGGGGGGEGSSREVWVEMYRRGLQTQTLFKTKIAHFATLFKTQNTTF